MAGTTPDTPQSVPGQVARRNIGDFRTSAGPPAGDAPWHPEHELRTDHLAQDIGRRTVRGGVFLFTAQAVKVAVQFGAVVILARLLPPAAFGLVAMTAALNAILDPLKELGLSSATIQKPDITHEQVSTLFWINAAVGAVTAAALIAAAPFIATFYRQPDLVPVTRWLALGFLIGGLGAQHWALLRRQMRLGAVALMESSSEILSFAVAIVLAIEGAGYWALVAQRLASAFLIVVGGWTLCRWRPGPPSRAGGLRDLFNFGASVSITTLLGTVARNLDQVLIGWLWGPAALGLYERASKLLAVPLNNICIPFYSVGMPMLSRLTDDDARYRRAFCELLEKLVMVTVPTAAIIAVTADWITSVLFGPRWTAAAPLVSWFGLAVAYYPAILAVTLLYLSQNRPGEMLRATFVDVGLALAAIFAGLRFGAVAVAAMLAVTGVLVRLPVSFWLSTVRGPVRLIDLYATMLPAALSGIAVAGAIAGLRHVLPHALSPLIGLVVTAPLGLVVAATTFWIVPSSRRALVSLLQLPRLMFGAGQPARS